MSRRSRTFLPSYWQLPPGEHNAITDVAGVRVGHATLIEGEGALLPGVGPVRTGVTVILPHGENLFRNKVRAAVHTINGFGKACGFEEVRELGVLEAPIGLTSTLNVWRVADALATIALEQSPEIGIQTSSLNVVVGECNDRYLNDLQGRHVGEEAVRAALAAATDGAVEEGCVGAGTGTSCFGWKGGIGTASRVTPETTGGFTVGALVQSNFGTPEQLIFGGVSVGARLQPPDAPAQPEPEQGSIMIVLATDAPLSSRQLRRLCVRATAGLARTGSHIAHGSGDFVIAFATAYRFPHRLVRDTEPLVADQPVLIDEPAAMAGLLPGVVEAVEEAVLNSLCAATTVSGRDGHVRYALPVAEALGLT
jgi:D-aminopeptidase